MAQPIYFQHLDPTSTLPGLLIDRDAERERLYQLLQRFVTAPQDARRTLSLTVTGPKGSGKSIVTQSVLSRLRQDFSAQLAILSVDCRQRRGWREVLAMVAETLREELRSLQDARVPVPPYGIEAAGLLRDIASMDEVKEEQLEEFTRSYTARASFDRALTLRVAFNAELGLELTRTETRRRALSASRLLDEGRVSNLLIALLRDLAQDGLRVVLFIDNLDELDHRYTTAEERLAVRQEVEGLLRLREAPVAFIVNVRTYFAGALGRVNDTRVLLEALPPERLHEVLARRLEDEPPEVLAALRAPEVQTEVGWLAEVSGSPLEFLNHVRNRGQAGRLDPARRGDDVRAEARETFPNLTIEQIERLVRGFGTSPTRTWGELAQALGNESLLRRMVQAQAVLPVDYWEPDELTLDPRLFPLRALLQA